MATTNPRSDKLISSEEKGFFRASMTLTYGYDLGQE
jgi:hypothetical protein